MTRISINSETITIKRSDIPSHAITPYPEHNLAAGVVSFDFGDTDVFHNSAAGYEQWIPEQEEYILTALGALIASREMEAQMNVTDAHRLAAEIREVDGNHDLGAAALAAILVKRGWKK